MGEPPGYIILGRGRWARRMRPIIAGESRSVVSIEETRQRPSESESAYVARLAETTKASAAQIAWLCVTPGPHVTLMVQAALGGAAFPFDLEFALRVATQRNALK